MQQAGRHQRTPGGLLLPMRATLKGRIRWQVLDERGAPEVPRNPSGFPLAPAEGVEQPNLITDLGLDQIAAYNCFGVDPASSTTWRRYMAVGTGSRTPANDDTTLDAEAQRAASSGSFSNGATTYELDDDADVWRAESLVTRLVTMDADRNVTEFGLSPAASGAIGIRELLRDGGGNPITVSLLNGKTLRVDHTLTVEIAAPAAGTPATINIAQYDAGNNLVGTTPQDIVYGGHIRGSIDASKLANLFNIWNPGITFGSATAGFVPYTSAYSYARTDTTYPGSHTTGISSQEAYIPGSHQVIRRWLVPAGSHNTTWYGYRVQTSQSADADGGFVVAFASPATYTKQNTDTVRVGVVTSWARAL